MKVAIIGSRGVTVPHLEQYLPADVTEIVSGGARGVDSCARHYAQEHHIRLTEFLPDYAHYGRSAPLRRNLEIIQYADEILAFWDGTSSGTRFVIDKAKKLEKPLTVYVTRAESRAEQLHFDRL